MVVNTFDPGAQEEGTGGPGVKVTFNHTRGVMPAYYKKKKSWDWTEVGEARDSDVGAPTS